MIYLYFWIISFLFVFFLIHEDGRLNTWSEIVFLPNIYYQLLLQEHPAILWLWIKFDGM